MSLRLRLHTLVLVTPNNRFDYGFDEGINAITGEIGSGKSTLLELAKYALGGNADLRPAVLEGVRRVVLDATIGQTRQRYAREIRGTTVEVLEPDGSTAEVLSVNVTKKHTRAADYLLDLVDWPHLRIASKRSAGRSQPISFFDLYSYCYVPQAEIDRSVVNHLDSVRQPKRIATFEILLGLTTSEIEQARVDIGLVEQELTERRKQLDIVDSFLAQGRTPSEEQLVTQQAEAVATIEVADRRVSRAHSVLREVTASMEQTRVEIADAAAVLRSAEVRLRELDGELAERRRLADETLASLARLQRAEVAADLFGPIVFMQCPRCFQAVGPDRFDGPICYVCAQPDPPPRAEELQDPAPAVRRERGRLRELEEEIRKLDAATQEERAAIEEARRGSARRIDNAEGELEQQSAENLAPAIEILQAASSDRATAEEAIRQIDVQLSSWAERARLLDSVQTHAVLLDARKADLAREREVAASRRSRVTELSELFDEIIQALDMPWYEPGAHIDPRSYLPVVNGVDIKNLGSGGMKMMTNVAYHLALLTYGLANRIDTIPDLLIIDSPRKNLGSSDEDQAHAEAFYRWITALTQAYEGRFQIIVADNDEPPAGTPLTGHIRLSREEPAVRDLPHPGGDVETIGS